MMTVERYGRLQITVPDSAKTVSVTAPSGKTEEALTFLYQPSELCYDAHGYEYDVCTGAPYTCFRYTPEEVGEYRYEAAGVSGSFVSLASDHPGYIGVSKNDPRYFASSDGHCFVPAGPNLCILRYDTLPAGQSHFETGSGTACTGMISYRRWLKALHEAGTNYFRLWLSTTYFQARTEHPGVHRTEIFNHLDAVMDLARAYGMRVRLCLDHFRFFSDSNDIFAKKLIDPETGEMLTDIDRFLTDPKWTDLYLDDIRPYIARYQNDPAVFAWEMWNEMPCLYGKPENTDAFAVRVMERVKRLSPKNMMCNSYGSFDNAIYLARMQAFRDTPIYDFGTLHRYLDQGAATELCRTDPALLTADGIEQMRCSDKPMVLNETGAVNDRHTGPFRFYCCDHDGLIFHDMTYTPFFAGAAASGHMWHWEYYLDPQNLWRHYKPFISMLDGIEADREQFEPEALHMEDAYVFVLRGVMHTLLYIRNRADRWDHVLRDGEVPAPVRGLTLPLPCSSVRTLWLMDEANGDAVSDGASVRVPDFVHGCVLVLTNG